MAYHTGSPSACSEYSAVSLLFGDGATLTKKQTTDFADSTDKP